MTVASGGPSGPTARTPLLGTQLPGFPRPPRPTLRSHLGSLSGVLQSTAVAVHLTLHVKVVPEWSQGQRGLSSLGYTTRGSTGTGGAA